ncbi:MAG: AMP-binding protein [Acidobacteriota bacterium]
MKERTRTSLRSYVEDMRGLGRRPAFELLTEYRPYTLSYSDVYHGALRAAALYRRLGLAKGDRLVLWAPNSPQWVVLFLGAVVQGIVVVPVDAGSGRAFVDAVSHKTSARLGICAAETPKPPGGMPWLTLEDAMAQSSREAAEPPDVALKAEDLLEIVFTSGTTAAPRGVVLTHGNLLSNLAPLERGFLARQWMVRPFLPLRFLSLLPLSHMFGQVLGVFVTIMFRSTALFVSSVSSPFIAEAVRDRKILAVFAVPRFLEALEDFVRREMAQKEGPEAFQQRLGQMADSRPLTRIWAFRDVHSLLGWRFWAWAVGGAYVPPDRIEFWRRLGYVVVQGYGLTETAPIITVNNPFGPAPTSAGRVYGDQEIRIAEDGEVLVRGANVMGGYFEDPEATREVFEDGWFRTGDIGVIGPEGHLHIKGRKKDVIVTGEGMNVFPEDVETRLNRHPAVRESAVIGRKSAGREEVHAVLILEDTDTDPEAVVREVNAALEPYQKIKGVTLWRDRDFPRTPTQKVKRAAIARALDLSADGPAVPPLEERLQDVLSEIAAGGKASDQARLEDDLGLSSLDRVELALELESRFQVELDEDRITADTSVADLRKLIQSTPEQPTALPFPTWQRRLPFAAVRWLGQHLLGIPVTRLICGLDVRFADRLAGVKPPVIFAANHTSNLDALVLLTALPHRFRVRLAPAMTPDLFPAFLAGGKHSPAARVGSALYFYFLTLFGNAYLLPPTSSFRRTLKQTGDLIGEGYCPVVFPEGHLTRTGRMAPFKPGIGMMIDAMKVPVVPVHLQGLYEIYPVDAKFPRKRGRVVVTIGGPMTLAEVAASGRLGSEERGG